MAYAVPMGCTTQPKVALPEITLTLQRQADAWNRGDIDAFMQPYWHSPELSFSSGGTTQWGWAQTLERYRRRYPTPERMGQLTFSDLHLRPLGADAALVLGRWHLQRKPDPVGGNFSLVMQRFAGRWVIVHDHTSQTRPPDP
ncbi:MAG: YybH family protein, partial [Phycisphaerae bacterium]